MNYIWRVLKGQRVNEPNNRLGSIQTKKCLKRILKIHQAFKFAFIFLAALANTVLQKPKNAYCAIA